MARADWGQLPTPINQDVSPGNETGQPTLPGIRHDAFKAENTHANMIPHHRQHRMNSWRNWEGLNSVSRGAVIFLTHQRILPGCSNLVRPGRTDSLKLIRAYFFAIT